MTVVQSLLTRRRRAAWSEADREAVWAELLPATGGLRRFVWRFGILSVLSTVLAAFGLIANSIATLIAGMLVDPLMTPILAAAAAMVHGQPKRLVASFAILCGGTATAITTGWIIAAISPGFTNAHDLAPELLLRTAPSLIDLGVAVAAGISAGYVLTHRDASSVLPGVAVAVALVPPLAATGVLLNVGAGAEAGGAFLLYVTNLGAIIVSAIALLTASGFVPGDLRQGTRLPVRAGFLVSLLVLVLIAVPLARQTLNVIEARNYTAAVTRSILDWDPNSESVELTTATDGQRGQVSVIVSTTRPVPASRLAELIRERTGIPVTVNVEYRLHTNDTATTE